VVSVGWSAFKLVITLHAYIQELLPVHPQQLPREEASGEAVGGLPHGDHHLRGPPHALPLQRRRRRRPQWQLRFHVALEIDARGRAKLYVCRK